jgi:hypothetical protein
MSGKKIFGLVLSISLIFIGMYTILVQSYTFKNGLVLSGTEAILLGLAFVGLGIFAIFSVILGKGTK